MWYFPLYDIAIFFSFTKLLCYLLIYLTLSISDCTFLEAARDPKPALEIVASTSPSASSHFESSPVEILFIDYSLLLLFFFFLEFLTLLVLQRKFSSGSTPQRVHSGSNPISVSPVVSSLISPRFDPQAATAVAEMASLSELQPLSSPGRNHHQHSTSAFSGLNVSLTSASGNSTIASAVPASVFGEPLRSSASDSVPGPVKYEIYMVLFTLTNVVCSFLLRHSRHHRSQSTTTSRRDEKKEKRDELTGAPSQITLSRREELLFELADQFQHRLEACMARLPLAPPTAISSPLASSAPLSPTSADRARAMSTTGFNTAAATPSASGSVDLLNRLTRIESSLTTIQKKISQYEQFFEHSFELQEHSNQKVIRLDSRVFYASCLMIAVIAILVVFIFR